MTKDTANNNFSHPLTKGQNQKEIMTTTGKYKMSNLKEQRPGEDEIRPHINPPWGIFLASRENVATLDKKPISNILQSIF